MNINVLEKEETKWKVIEWAEIINIRAEINGLKWKKYQHNEKWRFRSFKDEEKWLSLKEKEKKNLCKDWVECFLK